MAVSAMPSMVLFKYDLNNQYTCFTTKFFIDIPYNMHMDLLCFDAIM